MKTQAVTLARDGKKFSAVYSIMDGLLTVTSVELGRKSTQVDWRPSVALARILLDEMYDDHKRYQRN